MVQQVSSVLHPLQRAMQEPLALARITCDELRRWISDIEAGERENTGGTGAGK